MTETQYIDLFRQNKEQITNNSPQAINLLRDKALNEFQRLGFPTRRLEDYQRSDIARQFNFPFKFAFENKIPSSLNLNDLPLSTIKGLTNNIFYILNDTIHIPQTSDTNYPKDVYVGSLKEFSKIKPDICTKYYGQIADMSQNGIVAFNTLFAQDAFVVYIPDNTIVEQPLQLVNIMTGSVNTIANRRILVIAGKNSQAKIITCDQTNEKSQKFISTLVTEIYADQNAHIDLYELEENSTNTTRLASTFVQEKESASVLINNIIIDCGFTRNNYNVKLDGENSETFVAGVVITDKVQHADNFVFIDHQKPHCTSTQLFKYVLQDKSTGAFCGRIRVEKDAQKIMAYQTNNNLCASPDTKMYAKPQLEIYADDVKCSHGLTTGQLDEEALFYLRARGIPLQQAKLILMHAFAGEVLKLVRLESLEKQLEQIVEKRFLEHTGN